MKPRHHALALLLLAAPAAAAQNLAWVRVIDSPQIDTVEAVFLSEAGGVIAVGKTRGPFGTIANSSADLATWGAERDPLGQVVWSNGYTLGASVLELVDGAPWRSDQFSVVGTTDGGNGGVGSGTLDLFSVLLDSGSGTSITLDFDERPTDDRATCIGSVGDGYALIAGASTIPGTNTLLDVWVKQVGNGGVNFAERSYGASELLRIDAITPDGANGFYVIGVPNVPGIPLLLRRHDPDGDRIWTLPLPARVRAIDIQEDGANGVYVVGEIAPELGSGATDTEVWMARFDGAGAMLWSRELGTPADDAARRILIDLASDRFVVAGATGGDLTGDGDHRGGRDVWVAEFEPASGDTLWMRQLGSAGDDVVNGVASDGNGGVYLGGNTDGDLGGAQGGQGDGWIARFDSGLDVSRYCQVPVPNSTGVGGRMDASGDNNAAANDLTLRATQLPANTFGIFINSRTQGFVPWAGGSQGHLCLSGFIGRFVGPGQILPSGTGGVISLDVDLTAIPTPGGLTTVVPGDTWHFQAWHRDANPTPTSNYTDALTIVFR